jgi:hypothetical protein
MLDRQILPYIPVEESPSEGREEMVVYTGPSSLLTHHCDLSWVSTETGRWNEIFWKIKFLIFT